MKKHLPIAALAASALVLAGCASGTDDETSPSASPSGAPTAATDATEFGAAADVEALEAITWEEDGDGIPTLSGDLPATITGPATRVVEDGDGDVVESGQLVTVDYNITSGTDGSELYSTYEADAPESIMVSETSLDPALYSALSTASVGTDIIFATIDQTDPENPGAAIFMAMTVTEITAPLDRAEGTAVEPAEGLPTVTLDESGVPSVEVGDAEMPDELVAQTLIEGEGETVEAGDSVIAHYTGWLWDGEQFDSSWDRGEAAVFGLAEGQIIDGWIQGLEGQTIGSQVLLVIPPELGYGDQEQAAIPADSTLVFVVDILGVA